MIVIRVRHALMNMSGFTVHMSRMLNLRWSWQILRQGTVCKRESDRHDEAKSIERNENARSLYLQDPGQLRQHPEIGTPIVATSHNHGQKYNQNSKQASRFKVTAARENFGSLPHFAQRFRSARMHSRDDMDESLPAA